MNDDLEDFNPEETLEVIESIKGKGQKAFSKAQIYIYVVGIIGCVVFLMLKNYLWSFIFFILFCPQWQDIYRLFHKLENGQ